MKINSEKISTAIENGIYEQPSLTKYGTMKELVALPGGSLGDTGNISKRVDGGNIHLDRCYNSPLKIDSGPNQDPSDGGPEDDYIRPTEFACDSSGFFGDD